MLYLAHIAHQQACETCQTGQMCQPGRQFFAAWGAVDARADVDMDDCAVADPAPWVPEI